MSLRGELEQEIVKEWSIEAELESTGGIEYELLDGHTLYDRRLLNKKEFDLDEGVELIWAHDGSSLLALKRREGKTTASKLDIATGKKSHLLTVVQTDSLEGAIDTKYGLVLDSYSNPLL